MTGRLEGRVALVTGASRGLGASAAVALAKEGAHIIATARTEGGLTELDDAIKAVGGSATLVPLDIRDFDAIDRLGAAIFERWKKLDILIGNAGVLGKLTPMAHVDQKMWDEVMAVNVTANYRLIRSMDVLLRQSDAGRAVFVTSGLAQQVLGLLGPLLDFQGSPRGDGEDLCRRDRHHQPARQLLQPRRHAHRHARQGHAGRGPDEPAPPGRRGSTDRADVRALLHRQWRGVEI